MSPSLREEFEAIRSGGLCVQAFSLLTRQGTTSVMTATSLWAPSGRGRISFEHWAKDVPYERNLADEVMQALAKTDWARRAWRNPTLDTDM